MAYHRDYKKDAAYESTPEHIHERSLRNQARREYKKDHPGTNIKGLDIDHIRSLDKGGNPLNTHNLRAITEKRNRSWRHRHTKDDPTYG